jgi:ATP-dependent RNA helicase DeaD
MTPDMDLFPAGHPLLRALTERDYTDPTPVQAAVLEPDAQGRDLLVSAQTGSGKTVAYGLAIAETLLGQALNLEPAAEPLALIVAPTRELALQVHRELSWLYQHAGAQVVSCVGGMDPRAEQRMLARGAHIVVGTPGRLRDHLERGGLQVGKLRAVVLDEADEMLDLGFREDLEFILEATPQSRRTLLFSATLPKAIVTMARQYQRDAWRIAVAGGSQGHADIEYRAVRVAPNEIEHAVVNLLRFIESPTAMVFCNTRESVRHLQAILLERGFAAVALSGELGQTERNHALQALRDGRARVCVATDVAARGIDLPNLGLVIHAELPQNAQTLQHRSGRTGRAGRKGISVLLVLLSRRRKAEMLLQTAGVQAIWGGAPSVEDIRQVDQERLLQSPFVTDDLSEEDMAMARALLAQRSPEDIAAALVRMYRSHLPAAEEVFDPGPAQPSPEPRDSRPPREPRGPRPEDMAGDSVWFRLNVGRQKNADPRWLIPMICRQGKITKQEIGSIRIFERETRFEIQQGVAGRFLAAIRQIERADVRIEPLGDAPPPDRPAPPPRKESTKPAKPPHQAPWRVKAGRPKPKKA